MTLRQGLICEYRNARDRIHQIPFNEREWAGRILWCEGTKLYKKARIEDAPYRMRGRICELVELAREEEPHAACDRA